MSLKHQVDVFGLRKVELIPPRYEITRVLKNELQFYMPLIQRIHDHKEENRPTMDIISRRWKAGALASLMALSLTACSGDAGTASGGATDANDKQGSSIIDTIPAENLAAMFHPGEYVKPTKAMSEEDANRYKAEYAESLAAQAALSQSMMEEMNTSSADLTDVTTIDFDSIAKLMNLMAGWFHPDACQEAWMTVFEVTTAFNGGDDNGLEYYVSDIAGLETLRNYGHSKVYARVQPSGKVSELRISSFDLTDPLDMAILHYLAGDAGVAAMQAAESTGQSQPFTIGSSEYRAEGDGVITYAATEEDKTGPIKTGAAFIQEELAAYSDALFGSFIQESGYFTDPDSGLAVFKQLGYNHNLHDQIKFAKMHLLDGYYYEVTTLVTADRKNIEGDPAKLYGEMNAHLDFFVDGNGNVFSANVDIEPVITGYYSNGKNNYDNAAVIPFYKEQYQNLLTTILGADGSYTLPELEAYAEDVVDIDLAGADLSRIAPIDRGEVTLDDTQMSQHAECTVESDAETISYNGYIAVPYNYETGAGYWLPQAFISGDVSDYFSIS